VWIGIEFLANQSAEIANEKIELTNQSLKIDRQSLEVATRKFEAKRPFLELQLQYCVDATDAASNIATNTNSVEVEKAQEVFWKYYWGRLAIVEDSAVAGAMYKFGKTLPGLRMVTGEFQMDNRSKLKFLAIKIAHGCRDLINASWELKMESAKQLLNRIGDGK